MKERKTTTERHSKKLGKHDDITHVGWKERDKEKREPEGSRVDLICNNAMKQFELWSEWLNTSAALYREWQIVVWSKSGTCRVSRDSD